jgi:hypothetical protein
MDASLITATTSTINVAIDMCKALIGIRDFNKTAVALSELRDQLTEAQLHLFKLCGEGMSMQQRIFDLENLLREKEAALTKAKNEIAQLAKRHVELEEFEKFKHPGGAWACRRKGDTSDDVEPVSYCASCFENEQLSTLQPGTGKDRTYLVCPRCGMKIRR